MGPSLPGHLLLLLRRVLLLGLLLQESLHPDARQGLLDRLYPVVFDQHVQVVVDVPKKLSSEQEDLVRKLANLQNEPVGEKGFLREFWDRLTHTSANQAVD